jgi:hypothetical protein
VREMVPGLANEEQKEAALVRAGGIVADELMAMREEMADKTGKLRSELSCQPDDSEG